LRIFDTFLFRDELDILECRLTELDGSLVYRHVLVEARTDHQGHPKPLLFAENRERFAPWLSKIIHVVAEDLPDSANPWDREHAQRDQIATGLTGAIGSDLIILADADEIPSPATITAIAAAAGPVVMEMDTCMFTADWLWKESLRTSPVFPAAAISSFWTAREQGQANLAVIPKAGKHLTWLGGETAVRAKMAAHCHVDGNPLVEAALAADLYRAGQNCFGEKYGQPSPWLIPVDVDETWPQWVYERRCPANWFRPR
jgi:hypothetical protein